jgi:hypothetical protein
VATGNREVVRAMPQLLFALRMTKEITGGINDLRLLPVFAAAPAGDEAVIAQGLDVIARIAGVVFIKDFIVCETFIVRLLARPQFFLTVLAVLTCFIEFPEGVQSLKKRNVLKRLKEMKFQGDQARITNPLFSALKQSGWRRESLV